jgi:hypothetical protein
VDEELIRAAILSAGRAGLYHIDATSTPQDLKEYLIRDRSVPKSLKLFTDRIEADVGGYLALKLSCEPAPRPGYDEIEEIINELVDAFVIFLEGGKSWEVSVNTGSTESPDEGVIFERTVPMPDPKQSPYHSFTLLGDWINGMLSQKGFRQIIYTGSRSWQHPGWQDPKDTLWKLCYYGHRRWRFGGRAEFISSNECLRQRRYAERFHVPPDTKAIFNGFQVFSNRNSRRRIKELIDCL